VLNSLSLMLVIAWWIWAFAILPRQRPTSIQSTFNISSATIPPCPSPADPGRKNSPSSTAR
jgi:hypothetical protein